MLFLSLLLAVVVTAAPTEDNRCAPYIQHGAVHYNGMVYYLTSGADAKCVYASSDRLFEFRNNGYEYSNIRTVYFNCSGSTPVCNGLYCRESDARLLVKYVAQWVMVAIVAMSVLCATIVICYRARHCLYSLVTGCCHRSDEQPRLVREMILVDRF